MEKSVVTTNKDASIKECGDLLEKHDINGMPVMDNDEVVGVITRADIFKAILPRYPDIYEEERYLTDFECIEGRINKIRELKVKELMSSPAIGLNQYTPIIRAGSVMTLRGIKQLPVIYNDKLVGIITLTDICRNLLSRLS
jgi:CBS domain-containing protein